MLLLKLAFYFEKHTRKRRSKLGGLDSGSAAQSSLGSQRQQDARGRPPTHGVPSTASGLRSSAAAPLMGPFYPPLTALDARIISEAAT